MVDDTENSSLSLLLVMSGAVLLVAVGGWYLLEQEPEMPVNTEFAPPTARDLVTSQVSEDEATIDASAFDLDAELLKAQLAANADILVFPQTQSALYYYGNILEYDPQHAIANAEIDAVLARIAQTVSRHLRDGELAQAHTIATIVVDYRPEHELVVNTQRVLDTRAENLIQQAIKHAQDGNDNSARDVLAEAQSLPGRNPDYFNGVRGSMREIQDVRLAAEQDRTQRSLLEAEQARDAWAASTREAIFNGNLIAPAGASAIELLAETNDWDELRTELTGELLRALEETAQIHIQSPNPLPAEALIDAAVSLGGQTENLAGLRAVFENTLVAMESARIVGMEELVAVKTTPPSYPRRAEERGVSGSVDLQFTVTADGLTSDIVVVAAEPKALFDISAVAAVRKWEFQPREYRGQIISQRANARLVFRLDE